MSHGNRMTVERFWARIDKNGPDGCHFQTGHNLGPCWLWIGSVQVRGGYGRTADPRGDQGKRVLAHRLSYELTVGPIPPGKTLDHLCRVTRCVNPAHLEPVTDVENVLRGEGAPAKNARKVSCKYGHPLDSSNTIERADGNRECRSCSRELQRASKTQQRLQRKFPGWDVAVRRVPAEEFAGLGPHVPCLVNVEDGEDLVIVPMEMFERLVSR